MNDLTDIGNKIHKLKYAKNGEEWLQTCFRVANYVAQGDEQLTKTFTEMLYNKVFIPGGRVLANAGTGIKNLNNCFVLPIEDSRESIYNALKNAAELFAHGGGVGYNFSHIREEGAPIKTTEGQASGPLSFMSLFDQTGEVIQQASRRGAQMGILNDSHPDIEKFIQFKNILDHKNSRLLSEYQRNLVEAGLDKKGTKYFDILEKTLTDDQLTHFNISISLTDAFMEAVILKENWELKSIVTGEVVKTLPAVDLLRMIAEQSWKSGDPGVFFFDRTNEDNMTPYLGKLETTNPCGEVPLLSNEACCLGSINLHEFYDEENNTINWEFLEFIVRNAVIFLDNVQTLSETPIPEVNYWCKGLRRLGLGVMGWADLLAELEIPYNSMEAIELARKISWFISYFGHLQSMALAIDKGTFELYDKDNVNLKYIIRLFNNKTFSPRIFSEEEIRNIGFRNVAVTSIAPTGTIALLAGVNSSIEPFFALAYKRNITEGVGNTAKDTVIEINPILFRKLEKYGYTQGQIEFVRKHIEKYGSIKDLPKIFEKVKLPFTIASEIEPIWHIRMQAAWQEFIDNSISKTINLQNEATVEDIENTIIQMWNHDLKGGTIYRNGSKLFQILKQGV